MKFTKTKYEDNEKLLFRIALGILIGSVILFGFTILIINRFEFLIDSIMVVGSFGLIASAGIIIASNVRLIRFVIVIRKENTEVNVWKSAISVVLWFLSLFIYWLTFLILVFQSF